MPKYISSDKIRVFPFSKYRDTADLGSRLFYENNISRIIYQLIDTKGFVISGEVDSQGTVTTMLALNLHGYYFEIDIGESLIPNDAKDKVYAYLQISKQKIDQTSGSIKPSELQGQDANDNFEPFILSATLPQSTDDYDIFGIELLTKSNNSWKFSDSVKTKFDTKSLNITKIDGKH